MSFDFPSQQPAKRRPGGGGMFFLILLAVGAFLILSNQTENGLPPAGDGDQQAEIEFPRSGDSAYGKFPADDRRGDSDDWSIDSDAANGPKSGANDPNPKHDNADGWEIDTDAANRPGKDSKSKSQFQFSNEGGASKPSKSSSGSDWSIEGMKGDKAGSVPGGSSKQGSKASDWKIEDAGKIEGSEKNTKGGR